MKYRPPAGQGPFQRGERLTAAKLNDVVNAIRPVRAGGRAGIMGDAVVSDETETAYIRVTNRTDGRYSWVEVYRTENGTWANTTRTGNETYDWAVERNNQTVAAGNTVYEARRSPDTSEWIFANTSGGSGGNVDIRSGETVLMILGTYDEYKDCPDVPPSPPTAYTDYCNGTRGTELCVPAYAYAVYSRCGYVWQKVGDTRDFGVWANELNGQTFSAWRRFVIPRWGGDVDPATGLPDPDSDCMGVAFLGTGAGSELTCSCPSWASDKCVIVTFRTIPRPCESGTCGYVDCADVFNLFDTGDAEGPFWDREFSVVLTGNLCLASGEFGGGTVYLDFYDRTRSECYWGPDEFDPCDPCAEFGYFELKIELAAEERSNCGSVGHVVAEIGQRTMKELLCDCISPPTLNIETCEGCDGNGLLAPLVFIDVESIALTCCPDELSDSAIDLPSTIGDGESPPTTFQDV